MFFGVSTLQTVHVLISLAGIVTGLWVLAGMIRSRRRDRMTAVFLATTVATTASGFLFPFAGATPAFATGILSSVALLAALYARYGAKLAGRWRGVYVVAAVFSLYLNVFVLVVQLFLKAPALNALAPGGTEPPFLIAQGLTLAGFVVAGFLALRRFRI